VKGLVGFYLSGVFSIFQKTERNLAQPPPLSIVPSVKICTTCGVDKELSEYRERTSGTYSSECKKCIVDRKQLANEKMRTRYVEHKKTLSCSKCSADDYRVLDFHHPNDDKFKSVAFMVSKGYSFKNVMIEIDKCQVLCSNCHRIVHYKE
jgi:hypothetical protein